MADSNKFGGNFMSTRESISSISEGNVEKKILSGIFSRLVPSLGRAYEKVYQFSEKDNEGYLVKTGPGQHVFYGHGLDRRNASSL